MYGMAGMAFNFNIYSCAYPPVIKLQGDM